MGPSGHARGLRPRRPRGQVAARLRRPTGLMRAAGPGLDQLLRHRRAGSLRACASASASSVRASSRRCASSADGCRPASALEGAAAIQHERAVTRSPAPGIRPMTRPAARCSLIMFSPLVAALIVAAAAGGAASAVPRGRRRFVLSLIPFAFSLLMLAALRSHDRHAAAAASRWPGSRRSASTTRVARGRLLALARSCSPPS